MSGRYLSLYYGSLDIAGGLRLAAACLASPFVSSKRREARLTEAVRSHLGAGDIYAFSTARGALAATLRAAGIGAGDEVVLSALTCLAVPTAVLAAGARPVYVDTAPNALNNRAGDLVAALGPKVRAVVVQHTMGAVADLQPVVDAARARGVLVIEDCALALGTCFDGRPVGSDGDVALYSMEMSKTLSTGWGGIVMVRDPKLSAALTEQRAALAPRRLPRRAIDLIQIIMSALAYDRRLFAIGRYVMALGFRVKIFRGSTPAAEIEGRPAADFVAPMASAQLAFAARQWRRIDAVVAISTANMLAELEAIRGAGLDAFDDLLGDGRPVSPRTPFLVHDREAATAWFAARNVELGCWFDGPLTPLPESGAFHYDSARYPNASTTARRIVNLPSHAGIDAADRARIVDLIHSYAAVHEAANMPTTRAA